MPARRRPGCPGSLPAAAGLKTGFFKLRRPPAHGPVTVRRGPALLGPGPPKERLGSTPTPRIRVHARAAAGSGPLRLRVAAAAAAQGPPCRDLNRILLSPSLARSESHGTDSLDPAHRPGRADADRAGPNGTGRTGRDTRGRAQAIRPRGQDERRGETLHVPLPWRRQSLIEIVYVEDDVTLRSGETAEVE